MYKNISDRIGAQEKEIKNKYEKLKRLLSIIADISWI